MEFILRGDYFNGEFTAKNGTSPSDEKKSDELVDKYCPADLDHHLSTAQINYSNTEKVIRSACDAFKAWRRLPLQERVNYLKKFQQEVQKRQDEISLAIALESGKPLWEAKTEAAAVIGKVSVTIGDSLDRVRDRIISDIMPGIDGHLQTKPIGPSIVIGPFNFPCHLANTQILAALLTGNTVIFKPSEKTIYSAQLLIECFHTAGFPKGVINFINGTAKTTQDIIKHPEIKGIYFTGSLAVGQKILESVGTDVTKLVALELGGKNGTIVHSDAHIEHTLAELLRSCFLTSGQRCTSASLVAVHRSIQNEFMQKFKELTERIIIDHPTKFEIEPFMGPLIDSLAVEKYNQACALGKQYGAQEFLPLVEVQTKFKGHYVSPTIHLLEKAQKSNPFTQIEIFGPNCTFVPYSEIEEAIDIVNISDYGLAAGIFSANQDIYRLCQQEIDAGIINLNRSTVGAHARLPFGGVKNSGNYHAAAVSMIDHTVAMVSGLETLDISSKVTDVKGLK